MLLPNTVSVQAFGRVWDWEAEALKQPRPLQELPSRTHQEATFWCQNFNSVPDTAQDENGTGWSLRHKRTVMTIYSFYIFDRHCECIYKKQWILPGMPSTPNLDKRTSTTPTVTSPPATTTAAPVIPAGVSSSTRSTPAQRDETKLLFGVIFSLRNFVRKLSGPEDNFVSYRTSEYKLHYYETPTNLRFVMVSDVRQGSLRVVLHQIYVGLYVEYVVKNPLSPVEHPGGVGVYNDMFETVLDQFVRTLQNP